jgi:hypothetical protein
MALPTQAFQRIPKLQNDYIDFGSIFQEYEKISVNHL